MLLILLVLMMVLVLRILLLLCNNLHSPSRLLLGMGLFPEGNLLPTGFLGLLLRRLLSVDTWRYWRGPPVQQRCGLPHCLKSFASRCVPLLLVLRHLLSHLIRKLRRL